MHSRRSLMHCQPSLMHSQPSLIHWQRSVMHSQRSLMHCQRPLMHSRRSLIAREPSLIHCRRPLLHCQRCADPLATNGDVNEHANSCSICPAYAASGAATCRRKPTSSFQNETFASSTSAVADDRAAVAYQLHPYPSSSAQSPMHLECFPTLEDSPERLSP
jgi:hypothetical protein